MGKTKEYTNGEVTIVWEAEKCIHSAICVRGLPNVFKPKERPWITIDAAGTDDLVKQVKACPSGALSYYMNAEGNHEAESLETKVEVLENGPLLVFGTLKVTRTRMVLQKLKIRLPLFVDVVLLLTSRIAMVLM